MTRKKRRDYISALAAPAPRFLFGLAALPGFFLVDRLLFLVLLVLYYGAWVLAAGKRIQWGYFIFFTVSVTFFHLLTPLGRVIVEIGMFKITEGALRSGLLRGLGLTGMVFISLASIHPALKIPGLPGDLLGRCFYYFDRILEEKHKITWKNFFASLDTLLLSQVNAYNKALKTDIAVPKTGSLRAAFCQFGLIWGIICTLPPWLVWILTR
ncbi:MAG: hypothetical protein B0D92_06850 [Spirochaeta sp. LUC14_002_19_P3]|nr:MAG: hypothetical protein B0D92_06850 [Spirochaeta sp. LUC14_002_19_P3]